MENLKKEFKKLGLKENQEMNLYGSFDKGNSSILVELDFKESKSEGKVYQDFEVKIDGNYFSVRVSFTVGKSFRINDIIEFLNSMEGIVRKNFKDLLCVVQNAGKFDWTL